MSVPRRQSVGARDCKAPLFQGFGGIHTGSRTVTHTQPHSSRTGCITSLIGTITVLWPTTARCLSNGVGGHCPT